MTDPAEPERLEPVLGPEIVAVASGREPSIKVFLSAEEPSWISAVRPSRRLRSLSSGRAMRGPVGGFLRMREVLHAVSGSLHAEERVKGATRSTRDRDAALFTTTEERWWVRLRGPVGSLLVHLAPLLLLVNWQMSPPADTEPITMQLVMEPPPAPEIKPPTPQPQPKPAPPPQRGRLASEDLGDPDAKEADRPKGDPPPAAENAAKTETPAAEAKPPEKPQQMAAIVPPPLPPPKPDAPRPDPVPKPAPKPSPAAHQAPRRVEEPANLAPRRARYPGPAASRDEYLAYMHSLIRQHYNLLSSAALGDRRGMTVVEFVVLDDGKIALLKIRRSSGYPDIDNRVAEMVAAVGHFPPLPQWFQGLAMPFEFGFPFPEALRE